MTKNYITKAYVDMLHDKEKQTGVYFNTPKVIKRGVKYRKALSRLQKDIYEELWDLAMRAAHKGQIDEKGRVYVECSYSYMAIALDIDPTTAKHNMNGTGKNGKYTELFDLGLIQIKKRKEREISEYYVMAPVYEGEDKAFLTNDITTTSHKKDVEELKAKRAEYASTSKSKRETKNEQLENDRIFDIKSDNAEYEFKERERIDNLPDFDEKPSKEVVADSKPSKQMYFLVDDTQEHTGIYHANFVIEQNGRIFEKWSLQEFVEKMDLHWISTNKRSEFDIMTEIMISIDQNQYPIKYKSKENPNEN